MKTSTKTIIWIAAASAAVLCGFLVAANYTMISAYVEAKRQGAEIRRQIRRLKADTTAIENFHNIVLMDMSGSMHGLRNTAVEGAREIIRSVKAASDTIGGARQNLTLVFFDGDERGRLRLDHAVYDEPVETEEGASGGLKRYIPDGCTPLYDAIGKVIVDHLDRVGPHDYVLMTIITDGLENSSVLYGAADIRKLVGSLSEKNWAFTYIGANQDAVYEGGRIGIKDSYNYDNTYNGYRKMIKSETTRKNGVISRLSKGEK